ncbi:MAG: glycosyltransferase family 2 protein [Steroidobacteraceae bacterium]
MSVNLSVCIATYRRTDRLRALLADLACQRLLPDEVVIADNDATGSAKPVVDTFVAAGCPFRIVYEIQPERSIPVTRNLTVKLASGDWLAFVDDDERAPPEWLETLMAAARTHAADGVLAPVEPQVPESAPAWLRKGRFYEWPHLGTGEIVPDSMLRFGNVLLAGAPLRALSGPFDPAFGLSTGEDRDLLARLMGRGAKVIWCDEAQVFEPVEAGRLSLRWLLQRAYSGGQYFGRLVMAERPGARGRLRLLLQFCRWIVQLIVALVLALVCLPLGRHRAVTWLIRAWANVGKLTALLGWRYGEYA